MKEGWWKCDNIGLETDEVGGLEELLFLFCYYLLRNWMEAFIESARTVREEYNT